MTAPKAIRFIQSLKVPTGPKAGRRIKLGGFQKTFIRGAMAKNTTVAALCVARGNAKSVLAAGLGLGELTGEWNDEPRREVILAARTREQARICWDFAAALATSLPEDVQKQLTFRKAPRLEIEFGEGNVLRAIAADAKSNLGGAPCLAVLDERAAWPADRGDALENAILTGLGKRGGRALMISTSAQDDAHAFSRWINSPPTGCFVQEHRPPPGLPADDLNSLLTANPGTLCGIGATEEWLVAAARRAIARGGNSLSSFRNLNRNERISSETRDVLLHADEWLKCEVEQLPPREGSVVIGVDLGGSASMTAAAFYWPSTGRLETLGWFPNSPSLLDRSQADSVGSRYCEMASRHELFTLGDKTVPVAAWLSEVMRHIEGEPTAALVMDRYKLAEFTEAINAAGIRCPLIWRGFGFRDGNEDCDRFKRACFDGRVKALPSLLLRSAFSDAVCLRDPANNIKLAKARSTGRIDAASASVLAVAEGMRIAARPIRTVRQPTWAE